MNFFTNFSQGMSIGWYCIEYIMNYPTLLFFTAIPTLLNTYFMLSLLNTILRYTNIIEVLRVAQNHSVVIKIHAHLPNSVLPLLLTFFAVRILINLFNAALQDYTKQILDNDGPSLYESIVVAISCTFSLILWSIISLVTRIFITTLGNKSTQSTASAMGSTIIATTLKTAWSIATVFVVPFIIFSNQNVFTAMRSSYEVVKNNFSKNIGARILISFTYQALNSIMLLLLLPCAGLVYYINHNSALLSDATLYNYIMLTAAFLAIPNLIIYPIKHAAKNIFAVVLYNYSQNKNTGPFGALFLQN
jgi:hypothetical protein